MRADKFIRKEVLLPESVVKWLEICAKHDDRKVKKYMEKGLTEHARARIQHIPIEESKLKRAAKP